MNERRRGYRKTDTGLWDGDHRFTPEEQAEYDSLKAAGRTFYDDARWNEGATHEQAFADARYAYGLKRSM